MTCSTASLAAGTAVTFEIQMQVKGSVGSLTNTVKGQLDTKLKDEKTKLQDQLKSKLLGGAASTDPAASGAAAVKPEDAARQKLQDKLKGLFR